MLLPEDARYIVKGAFFRVAGPQAMDFSQYIELADKVCDRAHSLDKTGSLEGKSVAEIADVIYGGWYMWLFYWRNRDLIWEIANMLAKLAFDGVSSSRVVHTTRL